jgi:hypothetical protein
MTDPQSPRHPSDSDWHPQVFPTARAQHLAEAGLPQPPTNFEPYEAWILLAAAHLFEAVDTARDELERDRDFLWVGDVPLVRHPSPQGNTRQECINEAVRRFLTYINELQEG